MSVGGDHERILELLSAAADDALSDAERDELHRLSAASPETRAFAADLRRLESMLTRLPEAEPPDSLHDRIVTSLARRAPRRVKSDLASLFGWLRPATFPAVLRYGMAAAAGVVLATVVFERQQRLAGPNESTELLGTMAPSEDRGPATVLDSLDFNADGLQGTATLRSRDGALLLDIRIDAYRPVELSVDLASAGAVPGALMQSEGPVESFEFVDQVLRVRAVGRRKVTVLLRRENDAAVADKATIGLEFSSNGKLLQQGSLEPAW